jgi:hypothetical protein
MDIHPFNHKSLPDDDPKKKKSRRLPLSVIQNIKANNLQAYLPVWETQSASVIASVALAREDRLERCPLCGCLTPGDEMTLAIVKQFQPPARVCIHCCKDGNLLEV